MKTNKAALSVKFGDGTVVSGTNNFDAYVNIIKHIGTKTPSHKNVNAGRPISEGFSQAEEGV